MRQFDACSLCLQRAREPVSCGSGHLFCKECVYTDLRTPLVFTSVEALLSGNIQVAQKKDIKRQKDRIDVVRREEEEEKQRVKESARQRVLRDFEKGQLGLSVGRGPDKDAKDAAGSPDERV